MSTSPAQIAANIANAQLSSGPRSDAGKAASSQNGIKNGLFAAGDFVRPSEREAYAELEAHLNLDLAPNGILEQALVAEIRRATWKLRRCAQIEENLARAANDETPDPIESVSDNKEDARIEKTQRSVDRARTLAHRLLNKSIAELRRLQTERQWVDEFFYKGADTSDVGIADWRSIVKSHNDRTRAELRQRKLDGLNNAIAIIKKANSEASNMPATMQTQSATKTAA